MQGVRAAMLAGLAAAVPGAAVADWQYTRWGMQPHEVLEASKSVARPNPNADRQSTETTMAILVAPYSAAGFSFDAVFGFSTELDKPNVGGLARVDLKLRGGDCNWLRGTLLTQYGAPVDQGSGTYVSVTVWHDRKANNSVSWMKIGSNCSVIYQPLSSAKGL